MILTLSGKARAGKDTVALLLQDMLKERGLHSQIDRFAAPLKRASADLFGKDSESDALKEHPHIVLWAELERSALACLAELENFAPNSIIRPDFVPIIQQVFGEFDIGYGCVRLTPRKFQQLLGTDIVRDHHGKGAFVTALSGRAKDFDCSIVVDARFDNELPVGDLNAFVYNPNVKGVEGHVSEALAFELTDAYEDKGRYQAKMATRFGDMLVVNNTQDLEFLSKEAMFLSDAVMIKHRELA